MEDLFCLPCIRRIFGSPGTESEINGFDPVTKQNKNYSRYFLKIHSLQTMYASEEESRHCEYLSSRTTAHVCDIIAIRELIKSTYVRITKIT
jgi:hypothetical protein